MTNYLVEYGSKLFSGYRVVEAVSEAQARAIVESQGYKVRSVVIATEDA